MQKEENLHVAFGVVRFALKEGVSQGFKSWAVLNIMPFLKGFEDSFVKRPQ